jgi:hypothetical protein
VEKVPDLPLRPQGLRQIHEAEGSALCRGTRRCGLFVCKKLRQVSFADNGSLHRIIGFRECAIRKIKVLSLVDFVGSADCPVFN